MADLSQGLRPRPDDDEENKPPEVLNAAQSQLSPTSPLPPFKKPENIREALGNLARNQILTPIQQQLGYAEPLSRQIKRFEINQVLAKQGQENQRRQQLITILGDQGFPEDLLDSLDYESLQNVATNAGVTTTNTFGDTVHTTMGGERTVNNAPTNVRSYNFYAQKATAAGRTPVSYEEFITKGGAQDRTPAAVLSYQFLSELDPSIKNLSPEDQREIFMSLIRQDPKNAAEVAQAKQRAKDGGIVLTPGERKVDEIFAATLEDWNLQGARTNYRQNILDMNGAINQLERAKPGEITGKTVSLMTPLIRSPQTNLLVNNIERIVTENLRATLGAQFTENEAKAFIQRSFNVSLPEKVIAERLKRLRAAMKTVEQTKNAASEYWLEKGTVKGFSQALPEMSSYEGNIYQVSDYDGVPDEEIILRAVDPNISELEAMVLIQVVDERDITTTQIDNIGAGQ
jgi:hypothetical protein